MSPAYVMTRNVMKTPEMSSAGKTCPVGTYPMTDRAKNSPSVTKLTDMNEYRNASNFDQPLTRPVAFRRNRPGASLTAAIDRTPPLSGTPDGSAVDQLVVLHLVLLRVDRDDRRLQDALLVRAARVQRE